MPNASVDNDNVGVSGRGVTRGRPRAGSPDESGSYYNWTVKQLKKRAKEVGISGYSALTKDELIYRLRNR